MSAREFHMQWSVFKLRSLATVVYHGLCVSAIPVHNTNVNTYCTKKIKKTHGP